MNIGNVTHRRQRKSMLGTHRKGRESILLQVSDTTLFNIHEENRESSDSNLHIEETITFKKPEPKKSPELIRVPPRNDPIKSSPVTHFEPAHHSDTEDLSFRNERTLPIKRLDALFSPPPNDDSFVNHETMLANDDSVLATTLSDESPEETKTLLNEEFTEAKENRPASNVIIVPENLSNSDRLDRSVVESEKTIVASNYCDTAHSTSFDHPLIEFLDKKLREQEELKLTCSKQIDELQKKLDESCQEIEHFKEMKQFLLSKMKVPAREKNDNIESGATSSTLPSKTTVFNGFSKDVKPLVLPTRPSRQTRAPVTNGFANDVKPMIPSSTRHSRQARESVLLTPHSMSFNVQSQYERLLQ